MEVSKDDISRKLLQSNPIGIIKVMIDRMVMNMVDIGGCIVCMVGWWDGGNPIVLWVCY